jgi:hypothetical protein
MSRSKRVPVDSSEPFNLITKETPISANLTAVIRFLNLLSKTHTWIAKNCEKILAKNGKLDRFKQRTNKIHEIIQQLIDTRDVALNRLLAKTRSLAAMEMLNYRGRLGINDIDGFEFNPLHHDIKLLKLNRPKPTPPVPSPETLESRADAALEKERELIHTEMLALHAQLDDTEIMAMHQRAVYKVYADFIHSRIERQLCRDPDLLLDALDKMQIVQNYYLAQQTHAERDSEVRDQSGLDNLPRVAPPPVNFTLY